MPGLFYWYQCRGGACSALARGITSEGRSKLRPYRIKASFSHIRQPLRRVAEAVEAGHAGLLGQVEEEVRERLAAVVDVAAARQLAAATAREEHP